MIGAAVVAVVALLVSSRRGAAVFSSLPIPPRIYADVVAARLRAGKPAPGSLFGPRPSPLDGTASFHAGVDVACPSGTPLLAVGDGVVTEVRTSTSAGLLVRYELQQPPGRCSCMHLSRLDVAVGDNVRAGEVIGATGATGNVTGPHLHLEWKPAGAAAAVDPLPFFPSLDEVNV